MQRVGDKKELGKLLKKISNFEEVNESLEVKKIDKNQSVCAQIFAACQKLEIDDLVLDRFIKNAIVKSGNKHDKTLQNTEQYINKLVESGVFTRKNNKVIFNLPELEKNEDLKKSFMSSLEEFLLFDYVEKLRYEQYGLNDFYWALSKQNKKNPLKNVSQQQEQKQHHHEESHHHEKSHHHPKSKPIRQDEEVKSEVKALLEEFDNIACQNISHNKEKRTQQITEQKRVIDNIKQNSREFILHSTQQNKEKNQTIFVYLDPDFQDPTNPNFITKQITYIRDDATGKIDVLYGKEAEAIIIEEPEEQKNARITTISKAKIHHYGKKDEQNNSYMFQDFRSSNNEASKAPEASITDATTQRLHGQDNSIVR